MEFAQLLAEFGRSVGMGALAPDEDGSCVLVFDDAIEITLHASETDGVVLTAVVGRLEDFDEAALKDMLRKSLPSHEARSVSYAADPEGNVVLWTKADAITTGGEFSSLLDYFLGECTARSSGRHSGAPTESTPAQPQPSSQNDIFPGGMFIRV